MSRIRERGIVASDCEKTPLTRKTLMFVTTKRSMCTDTARSPPHTTASQPPRNGTQAKLVSVRTLQASSSTPRTAQSTERTYETQWWATSSTTTSPSSRSRCPRISGSGTNDRSQRSTRGSGSVEERVEEVDHAREDHRGHVPGPDGSVLGEGGELARRLHHPEAEEHHEDHDDERLHGSGSVQGSVRVRPSRGMGRTPRPMPTKADPSSRGGALAQAAADMGGATG